MESGVVGAVGPIADTSADAWGRTIAVLLHSVFYGTKHAARAMIAGGVGAGRVGSLLGLGGGILIVPLLTLGFATPTQTAALVMVYIEATIGLGLLEGAHAPGDKLPFSDYLTAAHNGMRAHGRAVQALRESEDHYRHMVELNPQTPWIMDPEGKTLEVSPEWVSTTGLTKEESRDHGWMDALHPDDVAETESTIAACGSRMRQLAPIRVWKLAWNEPLP